MKTPKRRLIVAASFGAALWLGALPAAAHPTVDVANPHPGDRVIAGSVVMEGLAWDHDARDGTGVERVWVRVCGVNGAYLGDATLGLPSRVSVDKGNPQFATAGWRITARLQGAGDERELCVTARSSVTGTDTLVRIPITIGTAPPPPATESVGGTAGTGGTGGTAGTGGAGGTGGGATDPCVIDPEDPICP
jgi:hypothetical protein